MARTLLSPVLLTGNLNGDDRRAKRQHGEYLFGFNVLSEDGGTMRYLRKWLNFKVISAWFEPRQNRMEDCNVWEVARMKEEVYDVHFRDNNCLYLGDGGLTLVATDDMYNEVQDKKHVVETSATQSQAWACSIRLHT